MSNKNSDVISPEEMNEFLMKKEVSELYFLHGVTIPSTEHEKDQMWDKMLLFSEVDNWCYSTTEMVLQDSDYPQQIYPADIEESMFGVFTRNIDLFLEKARTFSETTRTRILLYTLIVVRDYMSVSRLNTWKACVGL